MAGPGPARVTHYGAGKVEAAYNRGAYMPRRRDPAQQWANMACDRRASCWMAPAGSGIVPADMQGPSMPMHDRDAGVAAGELRTGTLR